MRALGASLCLLLFFPGLTQAQELVKPAPRQGYFLALGTRGGLLGMRADKLGDLGPFNGGAFDLRFGQMSNELFGFGLVISAGGGQNKDWAGGYGGLSIDLQYKPVSSLDLAIRGGVGVAGGGISRKDEAQASDDDPSGTFGALYTLGVSYDWFPFWRPGDSSGGFAITSFLQAQLLPGDGLLMGGVFIGAELTYWFGLPRNKLELPLDKAYK